MNDFIELPILERRSAINVSKIEYTELNCNPLLGCSHRCIFCYSRKLDVRWKKVPNEDAWHKPQIYTNFIKILKNELETGKVDPNKDIFVSTMTDVYQPFAFKHDVARKIITLLQEYNCTYRILTKSPLVAKDIDLYDGYDKGKVGLSITTNSSNDEMRKHYEPGTRSIKERLIALHTLSQADIRLWISFEPILPETNFWKVFSELFGASKLKESIVEIEVGKMNYMGIDDQFDWAEMVRIVETIRKANMDKHWHYKSQTTKYLLKHYPKITPKGGYP